ncbi:unnamed protein product [marine sediment metagenome]|uniref:PilN domain-containing protein n=1 Tax=marine sediment metagenome TaxID=412755 RepID=X0UCC2_9ZZZZ
MDYYFLQKRYRTLDNQITEIFNQTCPDAKGLKYTDQKIQHMKTKIGEIKKSALSLPGIGGDWMVLDLLKDISLRVSESLDVHVTRMIVDPEGVQIKGETDTFNTVDNLKKGLERSAYFDSVTINAANLDRTGKRVQFEIKLQRKK